MSPGENYMHTAMLQTVWTYKCILEKTTYKCLLETTSYKSQDRAFLVMGKVRKIWLKTKKCGLHFQDSSSQEKAILQLLVREVNVVKIKTK